MAKIVMVHGAFNELWGPSELKARWLPALRDGLWHHGVEVDDRDVAVCFYGDLFRRDPESAELEAFETTRAGVAEMLSKLAGDTLGDALGQAASEAAFDRTIDMITVMQTRPDLGDTVGARLDAVIDDETRIVVGHSLGSVISYRQLRRHPEWGVPNLLTIGSPLGASTIFPLLDGVVDGRAPWPESVQRWVNVAAVGDRAASVAELAPLFGVEGDDRRIEDRMVDNGHRAHDPEPYLNATVTGAVIAAALAG
jgi:pimeloyl-ACP methyl ester carboxylesterase